jgi:hypothetical protein
VKSASIFAALALFPTFARAQVATSAPGPLPQTTPSITLTGPEVDQLDAAFAKPSLMQVAPDGSMTPLFIVDGRSIHALLQVKIGQDAEAKAKAEVVKPSPADAVGH